MNRTIIQTDYTIAICDSFAQWLSEQMVLGSWSEGLLAA